jgi:hypothetical protein
MGERKHASLGVHIADRVKRAERVQQVLTRHGGRIETRLGLHDADEAHSSPNGPILPEVVGAAGEIAALEKGLKAVAGVDVKKMVFRH